MELASVQLLAEFRTASVYEVDSPKLVMMELESRQFLRVGELLVLLQQPMAVDIQVSARVVELESVHFLVDLLMVSV